VYSTVVSLNIVTIRNMDPYRSRGWLVVVVVWLVSSRACPR